MLTSLTFNSLEYIVNSLLIKNNAITDIAGFGNLEEVHGVLHIRENDQMISLSGMNNLQSVTSTFYLFDNSVLTSVTGLCSLKDFGLDFIIETNALLTDISSINPATINRNISIFNNVSLNNLDGFHDLLYLPGYLVVYYNSSLTNCCALVLILTLGYIIGVKLIYGNDEGKNNVVDIINQGKVYYDGLCFANLIEAINYNPANAGIIYINGNLITTGIITLSNSLRVIKINSTGSWVNHGTCINNSTIELNGGSLLNAATGVYKGNGTFIRNFINNGTISPGN